MRPFALTLQAQALELHRVWLALLALAIVLIIGWSAWALTDRVEIYEHSDHVVVDPGVTRRMVEDVDGSTHTARMIRERRLTAGFTAAGERIQPGQTAVVRVGGARLPAVVTDVDIAGDGASAVLVAEVPEVDPFARGAVITVEVAVGTASPLGSLGTGPGGRGPTK